MQTKDMGTLLLLSALWGGSFLCMRVAAPVLGPIVLSELRVLLAAVALVLYVALRKGSLALRSHWRHYLVIGIINSAIPFTLIATAELHLTAGLAAILNATSPLFSVLVAAIWLKEAVTISKGIGLLLGLVGVAVLVGWGPLPFTTAVAFSVVASLVAAACYGLAGVYTKVKMQGTNSQAVATCSLLGASLFLLPLTFVAPAQHVPALPIILAIAVLAICCTAVAYLLYFRLVENIGPTKSLTVTYLVPVFGVLWGAVLLGEPIIWSTIVGFAIIFAGTGLVTSVWVRRKQDTDTRIPKNTGESPAKYNQETSA